MKGELGEPGQKGDAGSPGPQGLAGPPGPMVGVKNLTKEKCTQDIRRKQRTFLNFLHRAQLVWLDQRVEEAHKEHLLVFLSLTSL